MWSTNKVVVVPEAKDLVVTLEKRTISSISVSARMGVIDAFSEMKRVGDRVLQQQVVTLRVCASRWTEVCGGIGSQ